MWRTISAFLAKNREEALADSEILLQKQNVGTHSQFSHPGLLCVRQGCLLSLSLATGCLLSQGVNYSYLSSQGFLYLNLVKKLSSDKTYPVMKFIRYLVIKVKKVKKCDGM